MMSAIVILTGDLEYALFAFTVKSIPMAGMEKSIHSSEQHQLQSLLRQVRRGAGMTQQDLARRLGQPQSFVSRYERGERRLDVLELRKVCNALGLTLTDFVSRLEDALP
jgi:ribosome-binding protein aMBF1 (putative translation factor)